MPSKMRGVAKKSPDKSMLDLRNSFPTLVRMTHRHLVWAIEAALQSRGLASGHWYFLRVLWTREGMTQSELSAEVGIKTPATVFALNALEKRGLIQRRPDDKDRRKIRVYLTPEGRKLERVLVPVAQSVLATALTGLTKQQVDSCRKVLRAICDNLRG